MSDNKTKLENNLNDLFDIDQDTPSIVESKPPVVREGAVESNERDLHGDIEADYKYARENLYGIIENGSNALNDLVEIAKASEHPRAFEVVSTLMKTLTDANKDLLEIQTKVKKLKQDDPNSSQSSNVTNNALFIGSTTELQALLNNKDS
jgi:hypothetical protein